jgi:hypothetical protein
MKNLAKKPSQGFFIGELASHSHVPRMVMAMQMTRMASRAACQLSAARQSP